MKPSQKKHDMLCEVVAQELEQRGWDVTLNKEYHSRYRDGELDILAYKDHTAMYVEVKSSKFGKGRKRGIEQLDRAFLHCPYLDGYK